MRAWARWLATALATLATLVAAVPSTATADPPTRITIVAVFEPITYGENAYVNGQLLGDAQGGQPVALEQSAPPFTEWTAVPQLATTDAQGYYSFKLHPSQTMQYRTNAQGMGSERVVQVSVAPRIKLKATFAGKTSVRFSGTFAPALDGQSVVIQRHLPRGGWANVTNARLHDGRTFAGRFRGKHTTTLRAFFATDGSHLDASSNVVKVTPPSARAATARAAACRAPSITRIATKPTPPVAARSTTLRVATSMPTGLMYAIDVLWGEKDQHDHLTLAPASRQSTVVFTLRHRYAKPGTYNLRIRVFGKSGACRSSRTVHPSLRVVSGISRAVRPAGA